MTGVATDRMYRFEEQYTTRIEHTAELPREYMLYQNYPNPFNPTTTIRFKGPQPSHVGIKLYDMLGGEVKTLFSQECETGAHVTVWDGKNERQSLVASGVYVVSMQAGNFMAAKKILLLK